MRIAIIPLDFLGTPPLYEPRDAELFNLALDYCRRELAEPIELSRLAKVWLACVMENGQAKEIIGIAGYVFLLGPMRPIAELLPSESRDLAVTPL